MLKIVEIHTSASAQGEYVVLQNQGLVTLSLRGWALCTDAYLEGDPGQIADQMYIFRDDIAVKPYTRVVLFTGGGVDGWQPTTDGRQAYCAYWGRRERIWTHAAHLHVLHLLTSRKVVAPVPAAVALSA
ncbi:MAG TPA: hypothetical protein VFB21_18115 [Chthonomonadaceae bacterium]|nr:hypothetical protein [Chthonomonadaceae bacterium]